MILFPSFVLGRSDSETLRVSTEYSQEARTFIGNWEIVLSRTPRISFPPLSHRTLRRGAYIDVQQQIMRK